MEFQPEKVLLECFFDCSRLVECFSNLYQNVSSRIFKTLFFTPHLPKSSQGMVPTPTPKASMYSTTAAAGYTSMTSLIVAILSSSSCTRHISLTSLSLSLSPLSRPFSPLSLSFFTHEEYVENVLIVCRKMHLNILTTFGKVNCLAKIDYCTAI